VVDVTAMLSKKVEKLTEAITPPKPR
jgi:hypothetical protein